MIAQVPQEILNAIPSKWTPYVVGAVLCLPYLTRGWSGWRNAGGLRGIWNGVMNGTNTPRVDSLGQAVAVQVLRANVQSPGAPGGDLTQRTQSDAEKTTVTKATQ
jgi:hypothetical protein